MSSATAMEGLTNIIYKTTIRKQRSVNNESNQKLHSPIALARASR